MSSQKKQANLETANQMWKDAFAVKKMKFQTENASLSEKEVQNLTVEYFKTLHKPRKTS